MRNRIRNCSHRLERLRQALRVETLEDRLVPDAALGAFAHFGDLTVARNESASVAVHVREGDFTMRRGRVVFGFAVRASGGGIDAGAAALVSPNEDSVSVILRNADVASPGATGSSLTLARVSAGDFSIRWRGRHGTAGPTELDVFLAGDANADFRVDSRDLDLIRSRAGTRLGEPGYRGEYDVDRDGIINRADVRLARLNLGAATTLRPPIVTVNLAPASDPDGNGVVLRSQVTLLAENARLFALLNIALADAGISAWDAKYAYNFWRPIDAIRKADTDGNAATATDLTWTPLLKNPPFPTYTSGHSTFSGAADAVLSFCFGPNTAFTSQSDGHTGFSQRPLTASQVITRTFSSFAQAADEAGRSRIYGGIHFEFDNAASLAAGRALGSYVVSRFLTQPA